MTVWVDAQLPPAIAPWITATFAVEAVPVRQLGLRDASDRRIYMAARAANAVVLTKDADFVRLQSEHGPPPSVLWLTCGNTSNARLRVILSAAVPRALALVEGGESLVEVADPVGSAGP